jgi:hypothetical protein
LYALILQHYGFKDEARSYGHLKDVYDKNAVLDSEDDNFKDTAYSGENDDDELTLQLPQAELDDLETGMLSEHHRLRVLERNTTIWGMPTFPSHFILY